MNLCSSSNLLAPLLGVLAAAALLAGCTATSRLTPSEAETRIRSALQKTVHGHPDRTGASILVHSDQLDVHALIQADPGGPEAYHIASVGKLFTAVLVGRLIDAGRIGFDTPVAPLLEPGLLDGLFVVGGRDCQDEVTVAQLLAHTSGVADYFADPARGDRTVAELIVEEPDRLWAPRDLLEFTRNQQQAVGVPGETFRYSDTGFVILGLLAEELSGMPYERLLAQEILEPLGMDRTWMPFRSRPAIGSGETMRRAWLGGTEVSRFPSITADWAGGGIASTEEDLLSFQRALWSGRLISESTLAQMQEFEHVFRKGIHYGKGLMAYRFGEFFFLLKGYPTLVGHLGILGTHLFYEPVQDLHLILSLGSGAAVEDSVKLLIQVMGILRRLG